MSPGEKVVQRKRKGKWREYVNEALLMGHALTEVDAMRIASARIGEEDRNKRLEIYHGHKRPSS